MDRENLSLVANLPINPPSPPHEAISMKLSFSSAEVQSPEQKVKTKSDRVQVYLRLKPRPKILTRRYDSVNDDGIDTLQPIDNELVQVVPPIGTRNFDEKSAQTFRFTRIFDMSSTQENIYDNCCNRLVEGLVNGQDGLLFAYGVTNAGKTFTIEGTKAFPGIIPRALQHIFDLTEGSENYQVKISCLQIYNEEVHDLQILRGFSKQARDKAKVKLRVIKNRVVAEGLTLTPIGEVKEGLAILRRCNRKRATHETELNASSSRSHSVFGLHIINLMNNKESKLSIVDLAGSERGKRTNPTPQRQAEANYINTSLMRLNMCLKGLRSNQKNKRLNPVHFRYSKLTHLLRDNFLKPNSAGVVMIVNCSTLKSDFEETIPTLNYGAEASRVRLKQNVPNKRHIVEKYDQNGRRITKKPKLERVPEASKKQKKSSAQKSDFNEFLKEKKVTNEATIRAKVHLEMMEYHEKELERIHNNYQLQMRYAQEQISKLQDQLKSRLQDYADENDMVLIPQAQLNDLTQNHQVSENLALTFKQKIKTLEVNKSHLVAKYLSATKKLATLEKIVDTKPSAGVISPTISKKTSPTFELHDIPKAKEKKGYLNKMIDKFTKQGHKPTPIAKRTRTRKKQTENARNM